MLKPPPSPSNNEATALPTIPSSPRPPAFFAATSTTDSSVASTAHRDHPPSSRYSLPSPTHPNPHVEVFSSSSSRAHVGGGAGPITMTSSFESVHSASSYSVSGSPRVLGTTGGSTPLFKRPPPSALGRRPILAGSTPLPVAASLPPSFSVAASTPPLVGMPRPSFGTNPTVGIGVLRSRSPSPSRFKLPPNSPRAAAFAAGAAGGGGGVGSGSRSGSPFLLGGAASQLSGLSPRLSPRTTTTVVAGGGMVGSTTGAGWQVPGSLDGALPSSSSPSSPSSRIRLLSQRPAPDLPSLHATHSSAGDSAPPGGAPPSRPTPHGHAHTPLQSGNVLPQHTTDPVAHHPGFASAVHHPATTTTTLAPSPTPPRPPPPSDLPPPLPEGWEELRDVASGRSYYYHAGQQRTTWDRPTPTPATTSPPPVIPSAAAPVVVVPPPHSNQAGAEESTLPPSSSSAVDPGPGLDHPAVGGAAAGPTSAAFVAAASEEPESQQDERGPPHTAHPGHGTVPPTSLSDPILSAPTHEPVVTVPAQLPAVEEEEEKKKTGSDALKLPTEGSEIYEEDKVGDEFEQLPNGWREVIDPSTGQAYYFHEGDGVTTWERPRRVLPDADAPILPDPVNGEESVPTGAGATPPTLSAPAPVAAELPAPLLPANLLPANTLPPEPAATSAAAPTEEGVVKSPEEQPTEAASESPEPLAAQPSSTGEPVAVSEVGDADPKEVGLASLPVGWQECTDPQSGQVYYFHVESNVTTWQRPALDTPDATTDQNDGGASTGVVSPEIGGGHDAGGSDDDDDFGLCDDYAKLSLGTEDDPEPVEPPLVAPDDGTPVELHEATAQEEPEAGDPVEVASSFSPVDVANPTATSEHPVPQPLPDGWQEVVNESSGQTYYFHEADGITTWDRPDGSKSPSPALEDAPGPKQPDHHELDDSPQLSVSVDESPTTTPDTSDNPDANNGDVAEPSALPDGWQELVEESSGMTYYFHEADGITTWDRPESNAALESRSEVQRPPVCVTTSEGDVVEESVSENAPLEGSLPEGWETVYDDASNQTYYFNAYENKTSWDRPSLAATESLGDGVEEPKIPHLMEDVGSESPVDKIADGATSPPLLTGDGDVSDVHEQVPQHTGLPEGWEEVIEPSSGQVYYYHAGSNTTSWDLPESGTNESIAADLTPVGDPPEDSDQGASGAAMVAASADSFVDSRARSGEVSNVLKGAPSLPEGWQELYDDASERVYYFHGATGVTSWDPPSESNDQVVANSTLSEDKLVETAEVPVTGEREIEEIALSATLDEVEVVDEGGTAQRNSMLPENATRDEVVEDVGEGGTAQRNIFLPEGWQAVLDPTSGLYYYVNDKNGTTSWELPVSMSLDSETKVAELVSAKEQPEVVERKSPVLPDDVETTPIDGTGNTDSTAGDLSLEAREIAGFPNTAVDPEIEHEEAALHDDAPELLVEGHQDGQQIDGDALVRGSSGSELPPGWEGLIDETSGEVYYYCESQGISSWERPTALSSEVQDDPSESLLENYDENVPESAPEETVAAPPLSSSSSLPDGWSKVSNESSDARVLLADVSDVQSKNAIESISDDWVDVQDDHDQSEPDQAELHQAGDQLGMDVVAEVPPEWTESGAQRPNVAIDTVTNEPTQGELLPGWVELVDPTTMLPYYFNEAMNETTWDRPVAVVDATAEIATQVPLREDAARDSFLLDGWEEVKDPSTGVSYYYNAATGETTWDRPLSVEPTKKNGRPAHAIATFGFGGRLCVLSGARDAFSSVTIHRTRSLLVADPIVVCESSKLQHNFSGSFAAASKTAVSSYLTERSSGSGGLLLQLVSIAASGNGKLRSDRPVDDPQSPESAIVKLLAPDPDASNGADTRILSGKFAPPKDLDLATTQNLVVIGEKEQAAKDAASKGSFGLSLVLASMCGPKVFEQAVANYAQSELVAGSPLYTAAMLFSGQVKPSRSIWGTDLERLRVTWRYHLAVLLNVRSKGWDHFAVSLGDTLKELKEVVAAHFCYLVCGCSLASPARQESRLTLLGCDLSAIDLTLTTTESIDAYETTEAYEWARLQGKPTAWIECLQPFKLVYAMLLADYGFEHAASTYLPSIKAFAGDSSSSRSPGSLALAILSCDRNYVAAALSDFEIRLTRHSSAKGSLESPPVRQSVSTSQGFPSGATAIMSSEPVVGTNPSQQEYSLRVEGTQPPRAPAMLEVATVPVAASQGFASTSLEQRPHASEQRPPMMLRQPDLGSDASGPEPPPTVAPVMSTPNARDSRPPLMMQTPAPTIAAATPSDASSPKASKPRSAPMSAPANLQQQSSSTPSSSSSKKKGFFSFGIRDKVTKWLNPDATQADLGEGMQAYYDEKLKVWVFPGEDPAEVSKPIGPPPTTPLAVPGTGPPSSDVATTAPSSNSNDPLAAMMAPPKRGPPTGWQHKSKSAGAALSSSASTPLRPPMPGMVLMPGQSGGAAAAAGGASGVPHPIMMIPVQPPTFAVFTPSPTSEAS